MTKKNISWMMVYLGILCIYIDMGIAWGSGDTRSLQKPIEVIQQSVQSTDVETELFIIEDEVVPGGGVSTNTDFEGGIVAFYVVAIIVTGAGIRGIAKKKY